MKDLTGPVSRAALALATAALLTTSLPAGAAEEPVPSPSPSPSAALDVVAELQFRYLRDPALAGLGTGSFILDVIEGDGALVALSQCPEMEPSPDCRRSILRSPDGLGWETVGKPLAFPGPNAGIAWTEAGFLFPLDDWQKRRPVLYRSVDGQAWSRSPLRETDYLEGVSGGPDGYLGFGCDRYCERTIPFWSADGRSWERDRGLTERIRVRSAATSGDTLIAIGEIGGDDDDHAAVSFRDGLWETLDLPLPQAPAGGWLSLVDVAALPDGGFAIVGGLERPNATLGPFLLSSRDGSSWDDVPVTLDLGVDGLRAEPFAIAAGPGLVALVVWLQGKGARELGLKDTEAIAWSLDGDEWHLATLPLPRGARAATVRDLLVTDAGRVVVVGETTNERTTRGAIWVASLGEAPPARDERALSEQELLALMGQASCSPFRASGAFDPFEFGALAAVQCDRPASGVRQAAVFAFPDAGSLDEYWSRRVEALDLKQRDRACDDGTPGRTGWQHGSVACYVSPASGEAKMRWTDERTDTYWLADATHRNVARLARWWRDDRP